MKNIAKLSAEEYRYILNIDDLQKAYKLSQERAETVKNSIYFSKETKETVSDMSEDLNSMLTKIINRQGIYSTEDYNDILDAIVLANTNIQIAICDATDNEPFGKYKKNHELYNEFVQWQDIQNKIGSKEWSYLFGENHKTSISFLLFLIAFFIILIIAVASKDTFILLLSLILYTIGFIFYVFIMIKYNTHVEKDIYVDQLHRTKNNTQYRSKKVLKSNKMNFLYLISMIGKKI